MNWLIIIIFIILLFLFIYILNIKQQQQPPPHRKRKKDIVLQRCADAGGFGNVISNYCNKFYMCAGNFVIPLYCGAGFAFNHITRQCEPPDTVDCQGRPFLSL
ncbi:hypothetical protein [Condylorrhiza vestigialis mutiple nucleopolyhedrovirus]|uniref:Chitin-binding type-2 domain-containing protein n=1 Tax=Condylorrhiza vestigialis mutiple nucleopolyhedrovirus TaxID=1592576 RepID=A0A0B4UL53_9ABAC|nr:hypothetical protein [Condylorrhiza vestigialis mutiple nucleopolyhedrovirus]AJD09206.1 hypothetical protein [Condylorrhiza vestigialis mutiple nucleopolyhedrovirus]